MNPGFIQIGSFILYPANKDDRRIIYEYNDYDNDFSIQYFIIVGVEPIGLHAHDSKEENFIITKGSGYVLTQLSHKGQFVYRNQGFIRTNLRTGSLMRIIPNDAHTFYLLPGSEMMCHSSKAFNPNKPDIASCNWLRIK